MDKIGVIGGLGPQASIHLYKKIIELAVKQFGAEKNADYPHFYMVNLPVPDQIERELDLGICINMVNDAIADFKKMGITKYAIACNTIHLYQEEFVKCPGLEMISLPEVVKSTLVLGQEYVVLGSPNTVKSGLYPQGVNLDAEDIAEVLHYINSVIAGKVTRELIGEFSDFLNRMLAKYQKPNFLIACTELPILVDAADFGPEIKVVNCTDVLAQKICQHYYDSF